MSAAAAAAATAESAAAEAAVRFICLPTCLTVEKVRKNGNWKRTCLIATHISNTPSSTFAPTPRPPSHSAYAPRLPPTCCAFQLKSMRKYRKAANKHYAALQLVCSDSIPTPTHTHTHELHIFI